MALGVLNNLSAVYAENNLNKTNSSLQTVLQQLSSGSRINSGADDAAGLSIVNGLQANSTALTQSSANATEGVGLLQVADGALAQVTNLLNRAVTLATEASNGTLNTAQSAAANQEYQSILAEINNIGSTTTYNQQTVFDGATVAIYTGDSSMAGSSLDNISIRQLSTNSVGDSNGKITYSGGGGQGTIFMDLTKGGTDAQLGDYLTGGSAGTSAISVTTLTASGTPVNTTIKVGAGTAYQNTVSGLVQAINGAGLGLSAGLTTAGIAGDTGATSTDTGIMITGSVGNGTTPSSSSFTGYLAPVSNTTDNLSGSITIQEGSNAPVTISMSDVNKAEGGTTWADLEAYLNSDTPLGIKAYADPSNSNQLDLESWDFGTSAPTSSPLIVNSSLTDASASGSLNYTSTKAYTVGITNPAGATAVEDSTTGQAAAVNVDTGTTTGAATATISYSDEAGQSLAATDLITQADAQSTLIYLNLAISDVASLDGYVGAQINTLNAISTVMSTQQENVMSAQNAIQATDYAAATSNMSKYEILSQTGIAALAQANSVEQEVTKLLQ